MRKKLLSMLLSVCMVLTLLPTTAFAFADYGIWVGTTKVTSENASAVTGEGISGTVTYDAGTNTLTLNNASITSLCPPGTGANQNGNDWGNCGGIFKNSGDLNIALVGSNTVDIRGVTGQYRPCGIFVFGGKVSITGPADSSLTVTGATTTQFSYGIWGNNGVAISGCTVTATGGNSTGNSNNAVGGISLQSGSLSITNATVTANGNTGTTTGSSFGIVCSGSATISNSTVTANGGNTSGSSYGIYVGSNATTISGSTVTATGDTRGLKLLGSFNTTGLAATASADKTGDGATAVTLDANVYGSDSTYKYVQITPAIQSQWGVAGSGGAAPSSWVGSGTLDNAMTYANANSGAYIKLQGNVDTTATIMFEGGKTTILDLNGKTIDAKGGAFSVLTVNGNLTLCDSSTTTVANQGKITGGNQPDYGGGVYIESTGTFTMTGGTITGNTSGKSGGGVYGNNTGNVMTMTGGSITGNHTQHHGGGVFIQTGGFTVGGTAKITGNTSGTAPNTLTNNVCLYGSMSPPSQQLLTISTATPLTTGASIGVRTTYVPSASSPLDFTGANSADYSSYFTSDNNSYVVQNSGSGSAQVVQLAVPVTQAPTVTAVSPTGGGTAGGTSVAITGTNLSGATAVKFGSTSATSFTVNSSTSITATAPAGTGTVDITVTTADGTSATSAASKFTYDLPTAAEYAAGASGTDYVVDDTATPHTLTIKTAKGAAWWSANGASYLDYSVLLANHIDVSGFLWTPVGGAYSIPFTGTFDGQGHSITGLTVNASNSAGLFSYTSGSTIQNISIASGSIALSGTDSDCYAGSLAGYIYNSTILNCGNRAAVSGVNTGTTNTDRAYVGGLVGCASGSSTITNCYNTGSVSASAAGKAAYAGGMFGCLAANKSLVNCYNSGTVSTSGTTATKYTGGLIGYQSDNITITSCYYKNSDSLNAIGGRFTTATTSATGCGTFATNGALTAGTADQFKSGQTLSYGNALLAALGGWVTATASTHYDTWVADNTTPVNGGYPVFGAAWASSAPTYTVDGEISSGDAASYTVTSVVLKQGGDTLTAHDFTNTHYSFTAVPAGVYNLVVTSTMGGKTVTVTILVTVSGNISKNVVLPSGLFSSKVTTSGGNLKGVEAGGLDDLSNAIGAAQTAGSSVAVDLTVTEKDASADNAADVSATVAADGKNVGIYLDLKLQQTVTPAVGTGTPTTITDLSKVSGAPNRIAVVIHLPETMQGKKNYAVYRYHDGAVQVLTNAPNSNDEYIVVNSARTQITAYLNKFSTYAIAYADTNTVTLNANGGTTATTEVTTTYGEAIGTLPTPNRSGYTFGGWYTAALGGTLVTASSMETNFADYTLYAHWTYVGGGGGGSATTFYTITVTTGDGGSISPSGNVSVTKGSAKTFAITPDRGYVISDVLVDGASVGAVSSYTFSDVTAAHTLSAVFAKTTGLPYYLDGSGNKVFIGFATEVDGEMKYVAPEGAAVQFTPNPKRFTDISGHWAEPYISFVTERELFLGTGGNSFSPDTGMTRAMFATVIGRLYERSYGEISAASTQTFTDCDYAAYYGKYITWAAENGIIGGYGNGKFGPNDQITREQMAAILYRFADFLNVLPSGMDTALTYPDAASISAYAKDAVLYCQSTGIITGRTGGVFASQETATRAEVSAIIERFIEQVVK